jgi:hypothetical protein
MFIVNRALHLNSRLHLYSKSCTNLAINMSSPMAAGVTTIRRVLRLEFKAATVERRRE